jgi:hypothetical protein
MSSGLSRAKTEELVRRSEMEDSLSPLINVATKASPIPHYAEYQMQASHALNSMKRSELPMQSAASAPIVNARLVQPDKPRQRILENILHSELEDICIKHNIPPSGTKKELSDRICETLPRGIGVAFIEEKVHNRKKGGKSHRRKSRHRRRKTSRAH